MSKALHHLLVLWTRDLPGNSRPGASGVRLKAQRSQQTLRLVR